MKYQVRVRVKYYEAFFEFTDECEAMAFARTVLEHEIASEDNPNKQTEIAIYVIKVDKEENNE